VVRGTGPGLEERMAWQARAGFRRPAALGRAAHRIKMGVWRAWVPLEPEATGRRGILHSARVMP
jgi:hypothetical protein